jgi:4'-phosphopantetheinyl transferase
MQPLAANEVRVWYRLTESIRDDERRDLDDALSADERERCHGFVLAHDRRDFAAAHALVRRTLSLYGDLLPFEWRFDTNSHGKPVIVAGQSTTLAFNVSHTRGLVACAVAHGTQLGVDVESINRPAARRDIAARCFSAAENRRLDAYPPHDYARRFVELWTLKESYIKAIGTGLNHPLDTCSFALAGDCGIEFDAPGETAPAEWQFALAAPAPGYCLAVAVRCASARRRYRITLQNADATDDMLRAPTRESIPWTFNSSAHVSDGVQRSVLQN